MISIYFESNTHVRVGDDLELGDGRVFRSGVRGNQALMKELLEQTEPPTWVTCRYFELTPDGVPRFPVVIDWGTGERND